MRPYRVENNYWKGWDRLAQELYLYCKMYGVPTEIIYLKEKYWTFNISVMWLAPNDFLIECNRLEKESETICEVCGRNGKTRYNTWWYKTLCLYHHIVRSIQRYRRKFLLNFK